MAAAVKQGVENALTKLSLGSNATEPSPEAVKDLKAKFSGVSQGHVFTFYDDLSVSEKAALFGQLSSMDPQRISVSFYHCNARFWYYTIFLPQNVMYKACLDKMQPFGPLITDDNFN